MLKGYFHSYYFHGASLNVPCLYSFLPIYCLDLRLTSTSKSSSSSPSPPSLGINIPLVLFLSSHCLSYWHHIPGHHLPTKLFFTYFFLLLLTFITSSPPDPVLPPPFHLLFMLLIIIFHFLLTSTIFSLPQSPTFYLSFSSLPLLCPLLTLGEKDEPKRDKDIEKRDIGSLRLMLKGTP